ncbi:hypothetical protein V2J09_024096 [Rumex salicifolius]
MDNINLNPESLLLLPILLFLCCGISELIPVDFYVTWLIVCCVSNHKQIRHLGMVQQDLIYSFVARGTVVLAEYTEFSGNFTGVATQCLQKLPASNNKFTYNCDGHTFNYFAENAYCVVATEAAGRQLPIAFLERVKEDFNVRYGGGKASTAKPNGLNKEYGPKLKEHMKYCVDHPEEINKLAKVKAQVSEVKGVMMENIEKVLDRGEKIELLVDKTDNLKSQAQDFRKQGTKLKKKMWFQNMKIKLVVLIIVIILILIVILSVNSLHLQNSPGSLVDVG